MKYIIAFIFLTAFLPMLGGNINLIVFYISPLRIAFILLPLAFVIKAFLRRNENKYYLKQNNLVPIVFMVIWFVYSLITVIWCKDISSWVNGEYYLLVGVVTAILFDMANLTKDDYLFIVKVIYGTIVCHNIIGWYELFTKNYYFAEPDRIYDMQMAGKYYPISMMVNPNDLVVVLILGFCLSAFFVMTVKNKYCKYLNVISLVSNLALIFKTESRLGILGLGIAIIILGYYLVSQRNKVKILLIGLSGIALSVVLFAKKYLNLIARLAENEWINFSNPETNSDAVRLNLIRNGFVFLKETFGFGVGTRNATYWMADNPTYYVRSFVDMHNWWVEILTNFGVLIFAGYIFVYLYQMYQLWRKYKKTDDFEIKILSIVFLSFLGAFIIAGMSASSNWKKEWLWIIFSLIIAFLGYSKKNKKE